MTLPSYQLAEFAALRLPVPTLRTFDASTDDDWRVEMACGCAVWSYYDFGPLDGSSEGHYIGVETCAIREDCYDGPFYEPEDPGKRALPLLLEDHKTMECDGLAKVAK